MVHYTANKTILQRPSTIQIYAYMTAKSRHLHPVSEKKNVVSTNHLNFSCYRDKETYVKNLSFCPQYTYHYSNVFLIMLLIYVPISLDKLNFFFFFFLFESKVVICQANKDLSLSLFSLSLSLSLSMVCPSTCLPLSLSLSLFFSLLFSISLKEGKCRIVVHQTRLQVMFV